MKPTFLKAISIIAILTSIFFFGQSVFEYVKQQKAYTDYFTKPIHTPGSSMPLPDTGTYIPYLIIGIIIGAGGIITLIQNKKFLKS